MRPFIISLLIYLPSLCLGQAPALRFQSFGIREGLPNQSIQSLYQDERGYLWIGTWDGLSRYDGYGFVNYQRDPFNPNSLAANDVKAIAEDTKGNLWIGSQGGLCSHDPQNQHFFQFDPPESVGRSWSVADIARDDSGRMWASKTISPAGIWMRDDTIWQKVSKMRAYCMLWDREQLCLGTGKGLRVMELVEDSLFESAEWRTAFSALAQSRIRCLHRGSEEQIWIGTQTGLYVYEQEQLRRAGDSAFGERNVLCMDDDAQGRLWIGTDTGLYVLDENGKTLAHFTADGSSYSLHDDRITSLLVDRGDNLWVGTYQGGLHKVPLGTKTRFQAYESSYFQSLRLTVFAFAEGANNRLWLGTNQGLYLLDKSSKQIIHHFAQGQSDTMGLSRPVVMSLLELADGRLLIGYGRTIGLDLLDWENRHIRQIVPKGKLGTVRKILPLHEPDQYLVVGTSVRSLDMRQETYQSLSLYDSSLQKSPPSYSWDAWQSPDSTIWIANKRGLIRHDPYSKRSRLLSIFPDDYRADNTVISILPTSKGDFWLGTYGAGLLQVDQSGKMKRIFTTQDGLPNNFVIGVLPDSNGHLWLSTNLGLSRFDRQQGLFQNFRVRDGLMDEEFATGAYLKASDGEIFMGGSNGFVSFYPEEIEDRASDYVPPLYLKDWTVSAPPLQQDEQGLHVTAYRGQRLELNFVALDFSDPNEIRYQWQLAGWEEEWQYPSSDTKVSYTNLPPGQYQFHLRASNSDGRFLGETLSLPIEVRPRLDQHWGFRLGLIGLAMLLVGGGVYGYVFRLREREKRRLERKIAQNKQEALASQMDQHFLFNSLNSIQRFVMENRPREAGRFISRFGRLIRTQLQQASLL